MRDEKQEIYKLAEDNKRLHERLVKAELMNQELQYAIVKATKYLQNCIESFKKENSIVFLPSLGAEDNKEVDIFI
jgi:hypothetical protein